MDIVSTGSSVLISSPKCPSRVFVAFSPALVFAENPILSVSWEPVPDRLFSRIVHTTQYFHAIRPWFELYTGVPSGATRPDTEDSRSWWGDATIFNPESSSESELAVINDHWLPSFTEQNDIHTWIHAVWIHTSPGLAMQPTPLAPPTTYWQMVPMHPLPYYVMYPVPHYTMHGLQNVDHGSDAGESTSTDDSMPSLMPAERSRSRFPILYKKYKAYKALRASPIIPFDEWKARRGDSRSVCKRDQDDVAGPRRL